MKNFFFLGILFFLGKAYSQVDSLAFTIDNDIKFSKINIEEAMVNKKKVKLSPSDNFSIISFDNKCNTLAPKYSDLNEGNFKFFKLKGNIQMSLSALGSTFSYDKKSEYYTLYFNRFTRIECNNREINYGVGFYVIIQVYDLKSKIEIKSIYDISAIGQLNLASVTLDIKHFGLKPDAADSILPEGVSELNVETSKYFDGLLEKIKSVLNDNNTSTIQIPKGI